MNFFKKIFGSSRPSGDMAAQTALVEELENTVKPFITEATKLNVQKASRPPEDSPLELQCC